LYLRSSGDGNTDEFFVLMGSVINRSLKKLESKILLRFIYEYLQELLLKFEPFLFVVHWNNDFQLKELPDIWKKTLNKTKHHNKQYSYGDALKRFGSIKRIIDSNKHGLTKVCPCVTIGFPSSPS
jgi:hypothetical protein